MAEPRDEHVRGPRFGRTVAKLFATMLPVGIASLAGLVLSVAAVLLALQFLTNGCRPPPASDAARERARVLLEDPIRSVLPPGGELLFEGSDPGHPRDAPFAVVDPSVARHFRFSGDQRSVGRSLVQQLRQLGWSVRADCAGDTIRVYGREQLTDFTATAEFSFFSDVLRSDAPSGSGASSSAATTLLFEQLRAPYPGYGSDRASDYPKEPTCVDG